MLHPDTVEPGTLDILNQIMVIAELRDFVLVGGTSLALQIGHRKSVDLDFFGNHAIDKDEILELLSPLGECRPIHLTKNILVLDLNGLKIDFANYSYPLLKPFIVEDGLRLISKEDIGAMKLSAITGRGTRRDFIDLFFLLKEFSLKQLLSFYLNKFDDGAEFLVARSLVYFDDAENDSGPILITPCDWSEVKSTILKEVSSLYS